ncbi:554_t:CDS:2, partial [Rhizophagus irregularis]
MSDLVARIFHPALRTLPKYASMFQQEHLDALRVSYEPANKHEVILTIPEKYILPKVDFDILKDEYFNVESLEIEDDCVRTFVDKLHDVIEIPPAATGTSDSMTDTLINDLLVRVVNFDNWPFKVKLEPPLKLFITNGSVSASPEFVVNKKNIAFICVE